jgi:hypothetical protein
MATNKAPDPGPVVGAYPPRPLSGGAPQPTPPQPHGAYDALEDGGQPARRRLARPPRRWLT